MRRLTWTGLAAIALSLTAMEVQAAEKVTLRNGFEMPCHHHAQVQTRVRLYTDPGQDNFVEVAPQDIASIETVPDPPPPPESSAQGPSVSRALETQSPLNTTDLHEMLASAGHTHNLDVDLLASVVRAESGGNARAVSRTGARGLMQLMPGTASELGVDDSFRPEQNIRGGSIYLDSLLKRYHDNLALALAAYNAGPGAVEKYHGIPPYRETRLYVAHVIHEFNRRVMAREADARRAVAAAGPKAGGR